MKEAIPADTHRVAVQNAGWTHAVPFIAWMVLMAGFEHTPAVGYVIRTLAGIVLLGYCAPWRWYDRINVKNVPLAVGMGVLVFGIWVLMETRWMEQAAPALHHGYKIFGILMPWKLPEPLASTPYAPEICGWWMTGVRVFGSVVVIAVIEEFFWRGFLYRWMLGKNFLRVPMSQLHWPTLFMVSIVFAAAHDRWLAALAAGVLYGWLVIRTRDIWAGCIAHGVTNLLLAWYVLAEGRYEFW